MPWIQMGQTSDDTFSLVLPSAGGSRDAEERQGMQSGGLTATQVVALAPHPVCLLFSMGEDVWWV
jgi:hypothetical protein